VLHADGSIDFPYLSEGCAALLGKAAQRAAGRPERHADADPARRPRSYLDAMHQPRACWRLELGRPDLDRRLEGRQVDQPARHPFPLDQPRGGVQWEGIMTNITASRLEQEETRRSRARLAELTAHSEQVKEQERTRIAREIHDDLGGNLTAIKMALAMLADAPAGRRIPAGKTEYLDALVDRTIDAVHRISLDLRPPMLDLGIVAALEWQAREFEKQMDIACRPVLRQPDTDIDLANSTRTMPRPVPHLPGSADEYRQARRRHPREVRLRRQRQHLTLTICDNGRGMAPADRLKPHSFGLRGMSERAEALGGTLTWSPAPGGGTMVTVKIRLTAFLPQKPRRKQDKSLSYHKNRA
jgi:two-component system sensor histidine kinase UhpB